MIDEKHRGTACRVLLADHVEFDVAELTCGAAEQRCGQIHPAPAVVRQYPDRSARANRCGEAAQQRRRPNQRHWMELTSFGPEPHNLPAALTGVSGQGRSGVDGVWEPHRVQHRRILVAVGVRMAVLQRDSFAPGEFTDSSQLAFTPWRAPCYATGDHTVLGLE